MAQTSKWIVAVLIAGYICMVTSVAAVQRGWLMPLKSLGTSQTARTGVLTVRPQAEIGADANGVYCTPATENGVSLHDLGALPAGVHGSVTVEGFSEDFNPVAAVLVTMLGEKAGNTVKTTTFYDNDSGGKGDARIDFVTPQSGTFILLVGDYTDTVIGCYRYQMTVS